MYRDALFFYIELKKSQYLFIKYNQLRLTNLFSYQHVFYTDHKNPFPIYISRLKLSQLNLEFKHYNIQQKKALKMSAFK